jgi:DNA-binding response OmpR family regulator
MVLLAWKLKKTKALLFILNYQLIKVHSMNKIKKIFIADDDEDILEIITMILRTKNYDVQATSDANDIFNLNDSNLPDLILMDIWMSGLDGREICRHLKEDVHTKDIPFIFVSANSNIEEITKEYKADDYIAKPFEMNYLLNKINTFFPAGSCIN